MKKNKKWSVILLSILLVMTIVFTTRKFQESRAVMEYYTEEYYPKFEKYSKIQKENYLSKLDENKITIKVEDLISVNESYKRKLSHRKGYIINYWIEDLESDRNFTYSFSKK